VRWDYDGRGVRWDYDGRRFPTDNGVRWRRLGWRNWHSFGLWVLDTRAPRAAEMRHQMGRLLWWGPYRWRLLGPRSA